MQKNNFESLSDNKIDFIKRLAFDDELAKCMLNKSVNFKNTTISEAEKADLMYKQIYPFPKTTGTLTDTRSYITMKYKYKKLLSGNVFKTAYVTFYIFCHEDIVQTPYMTLRYDYILQQVDRLLNDTRGSGWLGKLELDSMEDVIIDSEGKYIGVAVTYKNTEFQ
jgi:hypothetical protein